MPQELSRSPVNVFRLFAAKTARLRRATARRSAYRRSQGPSAGDRQPVTAAGLGRRVSGHRTTSGGRPQRTHADPERQRPFGGTTPVRRAQPTADRHGPQHRQRAPADVPTVTAMSLPSSWRAGAAALLLAAPLALTGCSSTTSGCPRAWRHPSGTASSIDGTDGGRGPRQHLHDDHVRRHGHDQRRVHLVPEHQGQGRRRPPAPALGTCTSTWPPIGGDCAADPGRRRRHAHRHRRPPGRHQAADRRRVAGLPLHQGHAAGNRQRAGRRRRLAGRRGRRQARFETRPRPPRPPRRPSSAPAKAAPAKAPAVAPKVVAPPTKAPAARRRSRPPSRPWSPSRPSSATRPARRAPTEVAAQEGSGLRAREGCTRIGSPGIFGYSGG